MKPWKKDPIVAMGIKTYLEEPKIEAPVLVIPEKEVATLILECVSCGKKAGMLFEGTSYCRECLQSQMRTGQTRRFYNA